MTDLAKSAERFVNGSHSQWESLVDLALALTPKQVPKAAERLGKLAGVSSKTVLQKLQAIRLASKENPSADIKTAGQALTLSTYVKSKNGARTDRQVVLSWKVAPELRDAAHEEAMRVARLLKLTTSNEFWSWMISQLATATDEDILHSAGACK